MPRAQAAGRRRGKTVVSRRGATVSPAFRAEDLGGGFVDDFRDAAAAVFFRAMAYRLR